MKISDIAAYAYKADLYCPECIIEQGIADGWLSPGARGMYVEDALDQGAEYLQFDRYDEVSFDSSEFPKVEFADELRDYPAGHEGDAACCGRCLQPIDC